MDVLAWLNDQLLKMQWLSELVKQLVEEVFGLSLQSWFDGPLKHSLIAKPIGNVCFDRAMLVVKSRFTGLGCLSLGVLNDG